MYQQQLGEEKYNMYPKNFPGDGGIQIGIVYGQGGVDDQKQDPLKTGNIQIWSPTEHSWTGVTPDDIALSTQIRKNQNEFARPFDPGSLVYCFTTTGRNDCVVLGTANDVVNPTISQPGNINLFMANPFLMEAFRRILSMMPKPDIQETNRRGARVKIPKEKQVAGYSHSLRQGLPSQSELFQLAGHLLPGIGPIPTAKQAAAGILSPSMLSMLPGINMSLGKMFKNLSKKNKKKITEKMPLELLAAFESISFLVPDIEYSEGGTYITTARVNEEVFMENAIALMAQATNLSDLMDVMFKLQTDVSLFGLDKLKGTEIKYQSAYGEITQVLDANGNVSIAQSKGIQDAIQAFSSLLSSAGGTPGANPVLAAFGSGGADIMQIIDRLPGPLAGKFKQMIAATNHVNPAQIGNLVNKFTHQGGGAFIGKIFGSLK